MVLGSTKRTNRSEPLSLVQAQQATVFWPSPQDYNEAVQNMAACFFDPQLKTGTPELTVIGLPKPVSGAFASVYKICTDGNNYALRCFLNNRPGQQTRYSKISEQLHRLDQTYTVSFEYQKQGVRIHADVFPVLKMEWVEGAHLDEYIAENLMDSQALNTLSQEWKSMLQWLQTSGIAHGDLQHGNVIIDKQGFKLVDYDGMFIPEFAGVESTELGHRNYQHPSRAQKHFGPWLDNFASWSIYTSIRCISLDPNLWHVLKGGEECLLFRQDDYVDPLTSQAFYVLENHPLDEVRTSARLLRSFLHLPIEQVPGLNAITDGAVPDLAELPVLIGPSGKKSKAHLVNLGHSIDFSFNENDAHQSANINHNWQLHHPSHTKSSTRHGGKSAKLGTFLPAIACILFACVALGLGRHVEPSNSAGVAKSVTQNNARSASSALAGAQALDSAESHILRSSQLLRQGNWDEALTEIDRAMEMSPGNAAAYFYRGTIRSSMGNNNGALDDFAEAIRLNPRFWQAYHNRAVLYVQSGELERAMTDLEEALQIVQNHGPAYKEAELERNITAIDNMTKASQRHQRYTRSYSDLRPIRFLN